MENPGVFTLFAAQISAPQSSAAATPITELDGISAATFVARFAYGSGGASLVARVQTTFDGQTWYDVARFDFATAAATKYAVVSGIQSQVIASLASLSAEGINDGLLGNAFRAVIDSTGSYGGNSLLDIRMAAR